MTRKSKPSSKKVQVEESFQNYKIYEAFEEKRTSFGTQLLKENCNNATLYLVIPPI